MQHVLKNVNMRTSPIALSVNRTHVGKKSKEDGDWGRYNTAFMTCALNVDGIAETIHNGWAIAPVIKGSRSADNFVCTQILGTDFDSCSLDDLRQNQFVADYAAILHTTSSHTPSAPRSRAIFVLEQPIQDAIFFSEIAAATVWYNNLSDPQCKDAARLWFGAPGCDIHIDPSKILPMDVISEVMGEFSSAHKTAQENGGFLVGNPDEIFNEAIKSIRPGNRNKAGFDLCCRLRDIGLSQEEATEYAHMYYEAAKLVGDHPYTLTEILASLRSAFRRKPRRYSKDILNQQLAAWEYNAWYKRKGAATGAIHYSLKSIMGVSQEVEKAGRPTGVYLPLRNFSEYGVPKNTADRHIKSMVEAGILSADAKPDSRRGIRYNLTIEPIAEGSETVQIDIEMSQSFKRLQGLPHFEHGAKIDPRMWAECPPDAALGPTALRIIAALESENQKYASKWDIHAVRGNGSLAECPILTHISSMSALWKVAGVGARSGERCFKSLFALGVCTWEFGTISGKNKLPALTENWYERLIELTPALTTYGQKEKRNLAYAKQRRLHHERFGQFGNLRDREMSQSAMDSADIKIQAAQDGLEEINRKKIAWKAEIEKKYRARN